MKGVKLLAADEAIMYFTGCPLLALSGRANRADGCPLSGDKADMTRTCTPCPLMTHSGHPERTKPFMRQFKACNPASGTPIGFFLGGARPFSRPAPTSPLHWPEWVPGSRSQRQCVRSHR